MWRVATPTTATPGRRPRRRSPARASPSETIPETLRYRLKNQLLGPPLVTEQLAGAPGRPIALGVLAPDCISSSAYGTEEMLIQLIPTSAWPPSPGRPDHLRDPGRPALRDALVPRGHQLYTKAGGAYVVARDNFGPRIAQIAAVALLIDYTVTVAVQTSPAPPP